MAILTPEEISLAQSIINNSPPGFYELRELYGSQWLKISSPTTFGKRFKETVNTTCLLKNIKQKTLKSDNHHTYEIS